MADRLRPDIAILDVQMPDLDGLDVARRAVNGSPETRVIAREGLPPLVYSPRSSGGLS